MKTAINYISIIEAFPSLRTSLSHFACIAYNPINDSAMTLCITITYFPATKHSINFTRHLMLWAKMAFKSKIPNKYIMSFMAS